MDGYSTRAAAGSMGGDHESASKMMEEPAAPKAEDGWKVESVSLRKAENGGVILTCSKMREVTGKDRERLGQRDYQSKDYAFTSVDEALAYAGQELSGATSSNSNMNMTAPQAVRG